MNSKSVKPRQTKSQGSRTKAKGFRKRTVPLNAITLAEKYKTRECDQETIERYADRLERYREEQKEWKQKTNDKEPDFPFPPPKVIEQTWEDGNGYECIGGNHTVEAARWAGLEEMEVEVVTGTERELLILAVEDNVRHGLPYTKEEMIANIILLSKRGKLPCRKISEIVGCSKSKVSHILNLSKNGQIEDHKEKKRVQKNFDPCATITKLWHPFEKHPESMTEQLVEDLVESIMELYCLLENHHLGDDFLQQMKEKFWADGNKGESKLPESEISSPVMGEFDEKYFPVEQNENFEEADSKSRFTTNNYDSGVLYGEGTEDADCVDWENPNAYVPWRPRSEATTIVPEEDEGRPVSFKRNDSRGGNRYVFKDDYDDWEPATGPHSFGDVGDEKSDLF